MKKSFLAAFILPAVIILGWKAADTPKPAKAGFPVDGWIILSADSTEVFNSIREAHKYGINHIQFSHNLIMNIDDLLDGTPRAAYRAEVINKGTRLAHSLGMKTYIWCHEFSVKDRSQKNICYSPDSPIWAQRRTAYTEGFKKIPETDGVILMYGSSPIGPWNTTCECDWCVSNGVADRKSNDAQSKRIELITSTVGGVIANDLRKELVMRTFVHESGEIEWHERGISAVKNVPFIAMHKSVVQDWQPYNPHDHNIGNIVGRDFIVENDGAGEFTSDVLVPYCTPGYLLYRLHYMMEKKGIGTVTRLSHKGFSVFNTPNFINVYAVDAFNKNPNISLDSVWAGGIRELYGTAVSPAAYPLLKDLLESTFIIRLKSNFVLGIWMYDQSADYPRRTNRSQFTYRGEMAKWDPNWVPVWKSLVAPDITTMKNIWQESTEAVDMSEKSLKAVPQLKGQVADSVYNDLHTRIVRQYWAARAWRAIDVYMGAYAGLERAGGAERDELQRWKEWGYWEMKDLLVKFKESNEMAIPVMGYPSLQQFFKNVEENEKNIGKHGFVPEAPLFTSFDVKYNSDKNTATVTFSTKKDCNAKVTWGGQLPFPENSTLVNAKGGKKTTVTLRDIQPDRRYILRLADQGSSGLYSGERWLFTY